MIVQKSRNKKFYELQIKHLRVHTYGDFIYKAAFFIKTKIC
jgi:hypothetical protein